MAVKFPRILVRAPNWIGDSVMAGPFLGAVRANWKGGHLAVLVRPKVRAVFERMDGIDEIIDEPGTAWGIAGKLRRGDFDLAFSLSSSLLPAAGMWLAGIPERAGYSGGGMGLFLTRTIPPLPRSVHVARRYIALGSLEGVPVPASVTPSWNVLATDMREARKFLRRSGLSLKKPLVAFAPGAAYGPAKRWFDSSWAALADLLALGNGTRILVVGGADESERAAAISRLAARPVVDATGRLSIGGTAALISLCRGFVSNDSGLMHLGAAVGTPTLGLFGSSNPLWTAPLGRSAETVYERVPCSPCYRKTCLPGRGYACLKAIVPEAVHRKISAMAGL